MDYINPAASKDYTKKPERVFRLVKEVTITAGTVFAWAPLERGGSDRLEAVVALGSDTQASQARAVAYLNVPLRVAEVDAKEWFEEVKDDE